METTEARRSAALKSLEALHPYDVPKILHWSPEANTSYKHWLAEVTQG